MTNINRVVILFLLCVIPMATNAQKRNSGNGKKTGTKSIKPIPAKVVKGAKGVAELFMCRLCSDKTTESGADEIYILVTGKRSDGKIFSGRFPTNTKPWDMNDGSQPNDNPNGDSHCITNRSVFSEDLEPGQTWNLVAMVMEEDGGTSRPYQIIAAEVLKNVEDPYAQAIGYVLAFLNKLNLHIPDPDDYIGSYGVKIKNDNGKIQTEWKALERVSISTPDPTDNQNPTKHEFRLNGDGANYVGTFRVLWSVTSLKAPSIAGTWRRSDGLTFTLSQNGSVINTNFGTDITHSLTGDWNSKSNYFDVQIVRSNLATRCSTNMQLKIRPLSPSSEFEQETSGTDGKCELPANFHELFVWTKQ